MQENKGFIATSLLYAFLLCFLTLFLAYMANYLQNKQLVDQIKIMAQDELENYKNKYVSELEEGDVVIFDTVSREGDKSNDNKTAFESLVSDNSNWILFKKEGGGSYAENGVQKYHDTTLYFISDISAQKVGNVFYPQFEFLGNGSLKLGYVNGEQHQMTLRNIRRMMFEKVYYNGSSQKYIVSSEEPKETEVNLYRYSFPYSRQMTVRLLNNNDLSSIISLDDNIANMIIDEKHNFLFWNEDESNGFHKGFTLYEKIGLDFIAGTNKETVNSKCGNGHEVVTFNEDTHEIQFKNDGRNLLYGHTYVGQNNSYVEYCYFPSSEFGECKNNSVLGLIVENAAGSICDLTFNNYPVRLVIEITVNAGSSDTDGYIDAGNGTPQLPYLITTGIKEDN